MRARWTELDKFASELRGNLIRLDDPDYNTVRKVWNGLIDKRPALIARCTDADDVITSVRFLAWEHDLLVSIRGGGHSAAGRAVCEKGLMIDLSPMKGIQIDARVRTARAEPGLRLGEFDGKTQTFGLATTLGVASDTGIAGLTLGGGYGWLNGKYGLACDNVLAVDVVIAEGRRVTASSERKRRSFLGYARCGCEFWGGHFLPVPATSGWSSARRLRPVPAQSRERGAEVFDQFSATCPDEVSTVGLLLSAPDGSPAVGIAACYTGPINEGERILKPLQRNRR